MGLILELQICIPYNVTIKKRLKIKSNGLLQLKPWNIIVMSYMYIWPITIHEIKISFNMRFPMVLVINEHLETVWVILWATNSQFIHIGLPYLDNGDLRISTKLWRSWIFNVSWDKMINPFSATFLTGSTVYIDALWLESAPSMLREVVDLDYKCFAL